MLNRRGARVQATPAKTSSYASNLVLYKNYFIAGVLVFVVTVVLAVLGGVGVFDSSSSDSSEVIQDPLSSSST